MLSPQCRVGVLLLASLLAWPKAFASEAEGLIKAAFLYKFCSYVHWPDSTFTDVNSAIVIGVVGNQATYEHVYETVKGRDIESRPFDVRHIALDNPLKDIHILYLGKEASLETMAASLNELPILIVTSGDSLTPPSIINFVIVDERVRFDISQRQADQVGIKLSSELLSVARQVVTSRAPDESGVMESEP